METSPTHRSRRNFLIWGGLATAALGLGTWFRRRPDHAPEHGSSLTKTAASTESPEQAITLDAEAIPAPNHEVYSPLLNTEFTVEFPETASVRIRLVEVTPTTTITSPKAKYQCFSLFFEASEGTAGEGQIARVSHPKLQPLDLFLAPVGRSKNGTILLEAAFTERV